MRFGKPEVFLSDNGREFKNKLIDDYLDSIGVVHTTTAPYSPQQNPTERVNRTLKTRIVAFIEGNHRDWDEKLRELNFSLNNTVHEATGYTPAFLNYGRQPIPPGTERQRQDRLALEEEEALATNRWAQRFEGMKYLQETAADRSRESQERYAQYYNARRRDITFSLGDLVVRRNRVLSSATQGVSAKLAPKFSGPYEIVGRPGANIYRLRNSDGSVEEAVHVSHLKPYVGEEASDDSSSSEEDSRPPKENEELAMGDPPPASADNVQAEALVRADDAESVRPSGTLDPEFQATGKRKPGRPRKNVRVVVRKGGAIVVPSVSAPQAVSRPRGRPKGSSNKTVPRPPANDPPRRTRAQRREDSD